MIKQHSSTAEKIALFQSLFRGRSDLYPRRFQIYILADFKIEKLTNLDMRLLVKMNGLEMSAKNRALSAWIANIGNSSP